MGRSVASTPNEDAERLARILDAKKRMIGVDKDALDAQVQERRAREAAEKDYNDKHAQMAKYYDEQVVLRQQQADHLRRDWNKDVNDFRTTQQGKATTREWDLNRPDAKRTDSPARINDDDARCGTASLQKFSGEDLSAGERTAAQMEQCKQWWDEQQQWKAAQDAAEKEADMAAAELVRYQDEAQRQAAAMESTYRREYLKQQADYNKQLAAAKSNMSATAKAAELSANMAEIEANHMSPLLMEDPLTATSALSPFRVRKDHWKGMTEAEKRAIQDTQLRQMQDNRARREAERVEDAQYARYQADVNAALAEQQRAADGFRRKQAERVTELRKQQIQEKVDKDRTTQQLYSNEISAEYFAQFGTSHR